MNDGCDKGCGYIDERDLKYIQTVEAIPKADYEARLKADLVAMLKEISDKFFDLYIEAKNDYRDGYMVYGEATDDCSEIIQEHINALKGNEK